MTEHQHYQQAIIYTIIATFLSAIVNAMAKDLQGQLDPFTIIFLRNIIGLGPLWLWLHHQKLLPEFSVKKLTLHLPRTLLGLTSYACQIYALQHLPLANASAISLSQPLFVAFLAPMLLKEKTNAKQLLLTLLGFVGILLILRPQDEIPMLVLLLAALHPLFYSLASIGIRHLSRTQTAWEIVFFYQFFNCIFTAPWALPQMAQIELWHFNYMLVFAVLGLSFQYCQVKSLGLARASAITPFNYLSLLWSIVFAVVIWHEWPGPWTWIGMGLIVGMGLILNFMARPQKNVPIIAP